MGKIDREDYAMIKFRFFDENSWKLTQQQTASVNISDDKWNSEAFGKLHKLIYSLHAIASPGKDILEINSTSFIVRVYVTHVVKLHFQLSFHRYFSPFSTRLNHFRTLMKSLFDLIQFFSERNYINLIKENNSCRFCFMQNLLPMLFYGSIKCCSSAFRVQLDSFQRFTPTRVEDSFESGA